ncbi:hypothetical protein Tco_1197114, partial [Tanacetum coccineum]
NMYEEEDDDVAKELYGDLNITQGLRDTDMTNAEQGREDQQNTSHESGFVQEEDNGHVTLTTVHDKTEDFTTTTNPTITLPEIPNFASLFRFEQRVSILETKLSEFNQTSQFAETISIILGIVDQYLASNMKEAVDVAVRLQSNKLKEEVKAKNQKFFNQVDLTMKAIIKDHVKAQVSKIMSQIEKYVTESLGAEVLVGSTNQPQTVFNDRLDWHNPEGHEYLFDLSKPLSLIEDQERQTDYFINNDLEYLKGGSLSGKYVTSTTRTKAAKYDNIEGIEDTVPTL